MLGLFRPKNSLILLLDHVSKESMPEFEAQVIEMAQFYRPSQVGELASNLKQRKFGSFALAFKNPRKSVFLYAIPWLLERDIPFTLYLQPDCVGTSLVPEGDEKLPVDQIDPLHLFVTWKKVIELPKSLAELGVWLLSDIVLLTESIDFVRKQTGTTPRTALSASREPASKASDYAKTGIESVLTLEVGLADKNTDPLRLPHFQPELI